MVARKFYQTFRIVINASDLDGSLPYALTQEGVAVLSSVLQFQVVFDAIRRLMAADAREPKRRIGFGSAARTNMSAPTLPKPARVQAKHSGRTAPPRRPPRGRQRRAIALQSCPRPCRRLLVPEMDLPYGVSRTFSGSFLQPYFCSIWAGVSVSWPLTVWTT